MKNFLYCLASAFIIASCGNSNNTTLKNPSEVQPPSEALPDSLKLVNDSVVVPDQTPDSDVKAKVGASDSIHQNR